MATQTINTRIKNKIDSFDNWQASRAPLLAGEIAIVTVETSSQYENPVTGEKEPVTELLMKVGNGTLSFADLPWLSAKASDVYDWAKKGTANEVPISIIEGTNTSATAGTLGSWLKTTYDKGVQNAANISNHNNLLTGGDTVSGTVANKIKLAIEAALDNLNVADTNTGNFVKAIQQREGKINVVKGNIELDDISAFLTAENITVGDKKLNEVLTALDAKVTNTLSALELESSGTGSFVTGLSYDDAGKITYTKGDITVSNLPANIPADKLASNAVTTAKIADSAVTDAKIATVSASKVEVDATSGTMLPAKLSAIEGQIAGINTAIAGGIHFIGHCYSPKLEDDLHTEESQTITVNGKSHTVSAGDVVIQDGKEFIWDGDTWRELGDVGRVATLETWRSKLQKADTAMANQFVTEVDIAADGTVTIGRAQPTSANVKHGDSGTVSSVLTDHESKLTGLTNNTVQESINAKVNALDLSSDPTSGGEAGDTENFVTQVRQTDGQVSYSRKTLPVSTTAKKGIVQLADGTTANDATKAATAASVKATHGIATNAQGRVANVESNYVRFDNNKLFVGTTGTLEIIFDCGTAANL